MIHLKPATIFGARSRLNLGTLGFVYLAQCSCHGMSLRAVHADAELGRWVRLSGYTGDWAGLLMINTFYQIKLPVKTHLAMVLLRFQGFNIYKINN